MTPTAERLTSHSATVFVAADSFEPLAEHIKGIVAGNPDEEGGTPPTGRLMTVLRSYPFDGTNRTPEIETSLSLDLTHPRPIHDHEDRFSRSLQFALSPGINGFGFSFDKHRDAATEAEAARRFLAGDPKADTFHGRRRNVTVVDVDGWPGQPNRGDRIQIDRWNDDGVCIRTVVAFEAEPWEHEAKERRRAAEGS